MEHGSIPGVDREVFERVWRRVMPEDRADCPFTLPEEEPAPAEPERAAAPPAEPGPAGAGADLQAYINGELAGWRQCRALARRLPGRAGQALAAVAAGELRHAKRLSALYFLLTGVRYWPRQGEGALPRSLPAALRERFWAASRAAEAYRAAARRAGDPRLEALFSQLAGEEEAHLQSVQDALELL